MADIGDQQDGQAWIFTWPQVKDFISKAANVCNVIASFGVIFAVGFFVYGQKDRETLEEASAWAALSNPRPGISVASQLEYLSKDGWFRSASTFDNVHLIPEFGTSGVSLDGLTLKGTSLEKVKADKASLARVEIDDSNLTMISLRETAITNSKLTNLTLINADISSSRIVNSTIGGFFTAANIVNTLISESTLDINVPKVSVFNQKTLGYDEYYRANLSKSFFRDSNLNVPKDDRLGECGTIDLESVDFYYSKINIEWESEEFTQNCMLFMDKSWIVGSQVIGTLGWTCSECTIAYSNMEIDESLLVNMETPVDGAIPMRIINANVEQATIYRSKIFGEATGISFANSKFLKADLSGLNFHGSNISGAEFDIYQPVHSPEADKPDNFAMIFWRGYGRSERSLKDIDEYSFVEELVEVETPEQVRARYPADGFKNAWAWRDRAPKGIPEGVSGPILCDEKLRVENGVLLLGVNLMPDKCKPVDWQEPYPDKMIPIQ